MSYKRAWLLLDSMNQAFTEAVVTAAPGGAGGGGATLTPFGAEVLERYRRIHDRAAATAAEDLALGDQSRVSGVPGKDARHRPPPSRLSRRMTAIRRLAAILAADVAGYSRLIGADEEGTLERLKALRRAPRSEDRRASRPAR
jgi:molybdate transport repressor ModE-like protein